MSADKTAIDVGGAREQGALRIPSLLRCELLLACVKLALRIAGWGKTWRWIHDRAEQVALVEETRLEVVVATEYAVAMAGALYPGRALCLEQSLVLYYLLRRQGVAVALWLGVQLHPFAAHAWVEYRGEPINDIPEHVRHFMPLLEVLP